LWMRWPKVKKRESNITLSGRETRRVSKDASHVALFVTSIWVVIGVGLGDIGWYFWYDCYLQYSKYCGGDARVGVPLEMLS
jgi:hypothetical protein